MSEINMPRAERGISPGEHEFARDGGGVLVGSFEPEEAGVVNKRGVEAGGNAAIDRNAGEAGKPVNQFGGGHHGGIDPVDVREIAPACVMVDVDEKTFFETIEKRAPDAVAFEQDDSAVTGEVCGD